MIAIRGAAVLALYWPVVGMAEEGKSWAATITGTSDYDYRGLSQTAGLAALQLDISYTVPHIRADVFTSNVDFGDGSGARFFGRRHTEIAYTADVFGGSDESLEYDAGLSYYTYPGWEPNISYPEAYMTLSHRWVSGSFHYTWAYDNLRPRLPAYYLELNVACPVGGWGTTLTLHGGKSWGDYWTTLYQAAYEDYAIGLSQKVKGIDFALRVVGTHGYAVTGHGEPFAGNRRVIASASLML
jgi:uncharacterized protein (TIGR02001 family)